MGNVMKRSKKNNQVAPQQQPIVLHQPDQYELPFIQMQQGVLYGYASPYEDMYLSNVTGLSPTDIARLRVEFYNYANPYGIIDYNSFLKLYIASLFNMEWDTIDRDAERTFRNFDVNATGEIDFNEYIFACLCLSEPLTYQY
jgi:Ca2+-binding EF-hand superfamily protein